MGGGALCRMCGAGGARRKLHAAALRPLHQRIHHLFHFQVKPTDMSTYICNECVENINKFYIFHKKVTSAQIIICAEACEKKMNADQKILLEVKPFSENTMQPVAAFEVIIDKIDSENKQCDIQDFASINKEQLIKICETDIIIDNKNELGTLLSYESAPNDIEIENSAVVEPEVKSGDFLMPQLINVFNFNYESDDDDLLNCDATNSMDCKESPLITQENCDLNKAPELSFENNPAEDPLLTDNMGMDNVEIPHDFPTEIIRDGKLIFKGNSLDDLIRRFYNIQCEICKDFAKFKNITRLMKHYKSEHNMKGYLKCCNTKFFQHRSIYMHMARHLQPSAFQCPICKKAVSRPHSLKLHIQTHLPEAEKPHSCDQCDRRFSYVEGLTSHKMTHIPVEKRKHHTCPVCSKIFTLTTSFSTHMRAAHTAAKFLCSECGRRFQRKTELTYHMLTHDPTGKNKVQCQECGYMCKNEPTLKIHLKRHSVDRIQCTKCDYKTHRQQQLNLHMRVRHTDEKPYVCVMCGKQFKLKSVLRTHITQHTGEHKFDCMLCMKSFKSPGNFHAHRKRMHPEEYRNTVLMKRREKFKDIKPPTNVDANAKGKVHELARQYLQKFAEKTTNKKTTEISPAIST